jgi:hypothetical protein
MYGKGLVLAAVLALPMGGAGDAKLDRATLRGLTAVNVVIDPVADELKEQGATSGALLSRLESKLRASGVPVDQNAAEFVALRLTSVHSGGGRFPARAEYAVAATIALYQPVMLVRDKNIKTSTQTWEVETITLADTKQVYRACMDSVDELAGRFVTAWRSVNASTNGEK